jgi:hypothetical protein
MFPIAGQSFHRQGSSWGARLSRAVQQTALKTAQKHFLEFIPHLRRINRYCLLEVWGINDPPSEFLDIHCELSGIIWARQYDRGVFRWQSCKTVASQIDLCIFPATGKKEEYCKREKYARLHNPSIFNHAPRAPPENQHSSPAWLVFPIRSLGIISEFFKPHTII